MSRLGSQRISLCAIAAVAFGLSSCGFTSRSDEFKCENTTECSDGRVCHDNWCVVPDTIGDANVTIDADVSQPDGPVSNPDARVNDAGPCPGACDSCAGDLCVVDCSATNSCFAGVTCPAGMRCQVTCSGVSSCNGAIDCTMATECDISCSNDQACLSGISCGSGACNVVCSGSDSCRGPLIDCDGSCSCVTSCSGVNSCENTPDCPLIGGSCRQGSDCEDTLPGCDTCP